MTNKLEEYREKRNFDRTLEPHPTTVSREGPLIFVVQKHRARQLHYDFRLELDGVLKSWAVPKGPSLDPETKRSAIIVEDHPIEYASFEGIIPKGEYGAGEVIIWDSVTYSPIDDGRFLFGDRKGAEELVRRGLERGKISFFLRGHKLKGSWTLVKMQKREKDWLLMKHRDEYSNAEDDILKEARSVISGRTIDGVKTNRLHNSVLSLNPKKVPGAKRAPLPSAVAPMLASLAEGPFSHPDWAFEPKLDGYRIISRITGGKVILSSRNGNDVTEKYATLVPDLSRQPLSELILDGEIIAMDEQGKQCF